MTASTPHASTEPGIPSGSYPSLTTLNGMPWRSDRFPTGEVHLPAEPDAELPTRDQWVKVLEGIGSPLAQRIAACGSRGGMRVEVTPYGRRLVGGKCMDPLCTECGPQIAARESRLLSDTVNFLTAEEGIAGDRFVFGAITMSHQTIPDTAQRVDLLEAALTEWTQQPWFNRFVLGWAFAFDVSGTLRRHHGVLHAHWHVFLVLRPDADLEHFKEKSHDWFQKRLGRENVRWKRDQAQWDSWISPAHLTPSTLNGKPGYIWKGAHEIGACSMKQGKHGEGHRNLYTRSEEDLRVLVPLMQKHGPVRRGGIVASVHDLLEHRDAIHEAATLLETKALPDGLWARIDAITRMLLLHLVSEERHSDEVVRDLIHRARTMPLGAWEAMVCGVAGRGNEPPSLLSDAP